MRYKKSQQKRSTQVSKIRNLWNLSHVTYTGWNKKEEAPVPGIGKFYPFFDDGKTSLSRLFAAEVLKVIPMKHVRKKMKNLYNSWFNEAVRCSWLYADKSDFAIKCRIDGYDDKPCWFFRTKDGGWFSIDYPSFWMSGMLDVNRENLSDLIEWYDKTIKEEKDENYKKDYENLLSKYQEFLDKLKKLNKE